MAITRLIPLFPFNLLNYAFGLTKIRFNHYSITSFICMFPATAAYVVLSSSLINLLKGKVSPELIIGVVLIAVVSAIPIIYNKRKKEFLSRLTKNNAEPFSVIPILIGNLKKISCSSYRFRLK
ncbi:MAG: VTT domain-containing protein [Nitrospinota bacterium]|nr:VTT domain-containing protein [Nitrospinota bacterium]